jgi:large subunit ribosomal protein L21
MYAIIQTGGKQYRVAKGDVIDVERLLTDTGSLFDTGSEVKFDQVLLVRDGEKTMVGAPTVGSFVVKGEVLGEAAGPKVISFKYKRRKNSHRKRGHRQKYSRVKILEIAG